MKSRLLVIIGIVFLFLLIPSFSYGTWREQPLEELWAQSQTIFVGNVISVQVVDVEKTIQYSEETDGVEKNIVKNYTMHLDEYTIEINSFLKNPQNFDTITVREPTVSAGIYQSTIRGFEIGDHVLFYIKNLNDINTYSPESQILETENNLFYFQDEFKKFLSITSPLKQFRSGISYDDIQCKDGLELVGKMPYAHPKCVKPESVEKLTIRGWATTNKTLELANPTKHTIEKDNTLFEIQYSLNGATLQSIAHDANANSIHVTLGDSVGGQMVISIPRVLLDAKMGHNIDDVFFLLIDGEENMYGEKTTDDARIITVWFPKGTHDIEIIGTYWI
ncbi:hypothetical protein [Nitrosopumilus ureiphilus]|uniref:Uncharacterized protein n=1 Tax=Nitrosopumilus ureiphilus TaxID=1470067 RepID=A0A7D5R3N2_9ARCH|nr:hypothetical protein [Nitrosopumilus ureiphilus]QLH07140.1 hypothetical protein C5F50_08680 [Nitrosopumilus ureiphilus]